MTNVKTTELVLVEVFTLQAVIGHVQNTAGALTIHPVISLLAIYPPI